MLAGWWQQLETDVEVVNYADANGRHAASNSEDPRAPQRIPDENPPSASRPEAETSPKNGPAQETQATRLDKLLAKAIKAAQRVAAQQAERRVNGEYAARMELEAQALAEAGKEAYAYDEPELEP